MKPVRIIGKFVDIDGSILTKREVWSLGLFQRFEYRLRGELHRLGGPAREAPDNSFDSRFFVRGNEVDEPTHRLLVHSTLLKKGIRIPAVDEIYSYLFQPGIVRQQIAACILKKITSRAEYRRLRKNAEAARQIL